MAGAANQILKLNLEVNYVSKAPLSQVTSTSLQSSTAKSFFLNAFAIFRQPFQSKMVLQEQN